MENHSKNLLWKEARQITKAIISFVPGIKIPKKIFQISLERSLSYLIYTFSDVTTNLAFLPIHITAKNIVDAKAILSKVTLKASFPLLSEGNKWKHWTEMG